MKGQINNERIDVSTVEGVAPIVLQKTGENWYILDGENFLAYTKPEGTTSNNYLYSVSSNVNGTVWTITKTDITNVWNAERKLRFNSTANQERFCAYLGTGSQQDVVLYKELQEESSKVGDVNGDGSVTIADVTALVNILLNKDTTAYDLNAADVDGEPVITVADVEALVNIILGKTN